MLVQVDCNKKLGSVDSDKKLRQVYCDKKLGPVDCNKKLGPIDCKKNWDQLIAIKNGTSWLQKKDNALFVIRSKTEASIVGLLSQTWGVSFDGRSGKERFPYESFLADK